jgi:uncharacterized membrane protein
MSETSVRTRRWNWWLTASLSLNLFLVGVIVMGLIVARNRTALSGGGSGLRPEVVLQMLPPSGGVKMCNVLAARMQTFRRVGRDVADARRAMFQKFRSEPFDEAAFRAALSRITAAEAAVAAEREAVVAEVVTQLTPDERNHFAREATARFLSPARTRRTPREPGQLVKMCRDLGVTAQ